MSDKTEKKKPRNTVQIVTAVAAAAFLILGAVAVMNLAKKEVKVKKVVHEVTLVKAPPPPKKYEKPPELEKKEEVKQEEVNVPQEQQNTPDDQPPAGNQLGLDAEGSAGGDGFGLVGNKGGRSLISGSGGMDLLRKYQWYTSNLQAEISRELMKKGKFTSGGREALVKLVLDDRGYILSHVVYGSSGSRQMDNAIEEVLDLMKKVSEPPPEGMPRVMRIKITLPA
jgi:outer membrane biosynthesis protein TonB